MRTTIYVVLIWKKNGKDHSVINHVCLLLGEEEKKIDYLPNIVIR